MPALSPSKGHPRGKVNLIAVVILGALAYGGWWLFVYAGVYLDNIDVKEAVDVAYNDSARRNDEALQQVIIGRCSEPTLGSHDEDDGFGNIVSKPGIGLKPENVVIVRDEVMKTISITVDYKRKVILKPTKKVKFVKFHLAKKGPVPSQ